MNGRGFSVVPIVCAGDRCVHGADLAAVAGLVGVEHDAEVALTPAQLTATLDLVVAASARYVLQVPFESLTLRSPDRDRPLRTLAFHIMHLPRAFLAGYDTGRLGGKALRVEVPPEATSADIAAYGDQSRRLLAEWWDRAGVDDPLDRVIETYWGAHTLLEAMERETWHAAQHTRQVLMFLGQLGIAPDAPLAEADFAGLPLPERVWD